MRERRIEEPEFIGDSFEKDLAAEEANLSSADRALLDGFRAHYSLANEVIELRKKRGLTQQELAARALVSQSAISRLERGNGNLSQSGLEKVAAALGVRLQFA